MHSAGGGDPTQSLTIVSVVFDNPWLIARNIELTGNLNPQFEGRWIVVDNSPAGDLRLDGAVEIMPGVPRPRAPDKGSTHHALALHKALAGVRTRYALLLDHDFYVLRPGWISELLAHVGERGIAFFGSAWNPRWVHQYSGFPSLHFLLVDLERIPVAGIDLTPAIARDVWWRLINAREVPLPRPLRDVLKAGRIRDAGWRLRRRFANEPTVEVEMLVPHHIPPDPSPQRGDRRSGARLPRVRRGHRGDDDRVTAHSALRECLPQAYRDGWEEHFWQGALFAVHLRRVGRKWSRRSLADDEALLDELLHDTRQAFAG